MPAFSTRMSHPRENGEDVLFCQSSTRTFSRHESCNPRGKGEVGVTIASQMVATTVETSWGSITHGRFWQTPFALVVLINGFEFKVLLKKIPLVEFIYTTSDGTWYDVPESLGTLAYSSPTHPSPYGPWWTMRWQHKLQNGWLPLENVFQENSISHETCHSLASSIWSSMCNVHTKITKSKLFGPFFLNKHYR